jgi:hypothetical protein
VIDYYGDTAKLVAERINTLFSSEETMRAMWKILYNDFPFDRTEHWGHIIETILNESWYEKGPLIKMNPTPEDKLKIIRALHPLLDYNLFTQVLLNLQGYTGMFYMTGDAQKEIDRLKDEWKKRNAKLDPFAPKVKMIKQAEAVTDEQKDYNAVLSTLRALRIITQFTPQISFRVSPKGSTPAFADSRNISMIGMGGDKYLKTLPTLKTFYITWDSVPQMALPTRTELIDGKPGIVFFAPDIPYEFKSRSGGEILQEVLFARRLMYEVFKGVNTTKEVCIMIPRINSLLLVADVAGESIRSTFELLKQRYPMIQLVEGQRA